MNDFFNQLFEYWNVTFHLTKFLQFISFFFLILQYETNRIMSIKISKPTESELDILRFLWQNEQASVREVHEELASKKDVGYTTTLKLMQIMFEKGLVIRDDKSKIHIYKPNVSQETTQQQFLPKFIDTLFSGSSTQLVMQALGSHTPTANEIDEIQQLLNELKKK